jgi:hypothetical protein
VALIKIQDWTLNEVLVAHQRLDSGSCLCGWNEYGRSYTQHVVHEIRVAAEAQA